MATDTYAGLPVRRGLFQCDDWQRLAEDLMAFQDAVQEALGTEEAGDVLPAIARLKARAAVVEDPDGAVAERQAALLARLRERAEQKRGNDDG